jgi:hypothetical protein
MLTRRIGSKSSQLTSMIWMSLLVDRSDLRVKVRSGCCQETYAMSQQFSGIGFTGRIGVHTDCPAVILVIVICHGSCVRMMSVLSIRWFNKVCITVFRCWQLCCTICKVVGNCCVLFFLLLLSFIGNLCVLLGLFLCLCYLVLFLLLFLSLLLPCPLLFLLLLLPSGHLALLVTSSSVGHQGNVLLYSLHRAAFL